MSAQRIRSLAVTPLLLIAVIGVAGLLGVLTGPIGTRVAIIAIVYVVFTTGQGVFTSNTGIMSFGHMAFMALGAYVVAYATVPPSTKSFLFPDMPKSLGFMVRIHVVFPVALVAALVVGALVALIVAPAISRLEGLPSGIATLALLIIVYTVIANWTSVTRGHSSVIGVPGSVNLWWAIGIAALAVFAAWAYKNSVSGLQLRASREDRPAAVASGIAIGRHRTIAWVISGGLCSMAGALYAGFVTTFSIDQFFLTGTFAAIVMIVIGGYLSVSGIVIGTLFVSFLEEILRRVQDGAFGFAAPPGTADLVLALLLLLVLIRSPLGLMGLRELGIRTGRRSRVRGPTAVSQ